MADGGRLPLRGSKLRSRNSIVRLVLLCPSRLTHLYHLPWCLRALCIGELVFIPRTDNLVKIFPTRVGFM
jgi:hypothetical protein